MAFSELVGNRRCFVAEACKVETAGGSVQRKTILKSNVVGGLRNLPPKHGGTNQRANLTDGSALVRPGFSGSGTHAQNLALEKIKMPITLTKKKRNQRDNIRLSL
jgi:hypothetical protein